MIDKRQFEERVAQRTGADVEPVGIVRGELVVGAQLDGVSVRGHLDLGW